MLVLSRKHHESVIVGGRFGLTVTVVQVGNGKVRLGFDVSPEVPVHRAEVYERIRCDTERAARPVRAPRLKLV
jgi:carbon storage regulator